jgi:hypothetical protein
MPIDQPDIRWHAVAIVPKGHCCRAVLELQGTRFLTRLQPPRLPLPDCTMPDRCRCIYRHFSDRRRGTPRRRDEIGLPRLPIAPGSERRTNRGRRSDD